MIPPERRKWLAEHLHRLADEEERKGLTEIAVEFRQRANMLGQDLDPKTKLGGARDRIRDVEAELLHGRRALKANREALAEAAGEAAL
jgi:hypothetical protein